MYCSRRYHWKLQEHKTSSSSIASPIPSAFPYDTRIFSREPHEAVHQHVIVGMSLTNLVQRPQKHAAADHPQIGPGFATAQPARDVQDIECFHQLLGAAAVVAILMTCALGVDNGQFEIGIRFARPSSAPYWRTDLDEIFCQHSHAETHRWWTSGLTCAYLVTGPCSSKVSATVSTSPRSKAPRRTKHSMWCLPWKVLSTEGSMPYLAIQKLS